MLGSIPTYKPGRATGGVGAGGGPGTAAAAPVKLSSNELPFEPLPDVLAAYRRAAGELNRYPDMTCSELVHALAERHGVQPAQVVPATGSVAVLYHLLQAFCEAGDEVVYAWRSFEAYPIAVALPGAVPVPVPLGPGARHDIDAMIAAVTDRTVAVLVCTPNNPTGPVVTRAELARLIDAVPADVLVVVDEAYIEFATDGDAADGPAELAAHRNVVVLRTFSKAWGLAGARVGYLLADEAVAAAARACALPFGVPYASAEAALAALAAEPTMHTRVGLVVAERERLLPRLRSLGLEVPDSQANFVWLPVGDRALELAATTERAGLITRPFAGAGVRATVGRPTDNDRLQDAIAIWVTTTSS